MENELPVEYFVVCIYCKNDYIIISTPANSADWRELQNRIGTEFWMVWKMQRLLRRLKAISEDSLKDLWPINHPPSPQN